jgi:AcrR family transcriptional regulator
MKASDDMAGILDNRVSDGIARVFCCTAPSRADARRDKLLEAARTLFAERGFHATGVAQIAKASGVLVGQIYRDFANKEEIVAAIAASDLQESLGEEELVRAADAGDTAAVRAWIRRFVSAKAKKDCRLGAEIMAESMRNPKVAEIFRAIQQRVRASLTLALEALAPGAARAGERHLTAEIIMTIGGGIFHVGAYYSGADGRACLDPQLEGRLIALVDREVDALLAA